MAAIAITELVRLNLMFRRLGVEPEADAVVLLDLKIFPTARIP